jgi:acyl carrier protein
MIDESIKQQLIDITYDVLKERGIDTTVDMETPLNEEGIGLDSISRLTLLGKLEGHFKIEFPEEYWGSKTFVNLEAIKTFIDGHID